MPLKPKSGSKHLRPKDEHLDYTSRQYLKAITIYPIPPLGGHEQANNYAKHSAFCNTSFFSWNNHLRPHSETIL